MKSMKRILLLVALAVCGTVSAKDYTVKSPDGRLVLTVSDNGRLHYTLSCDQQPLLQDCGLGLSINGTDPCAKPSVKSTKRSHVSETVQAQLYRQREYTAECNQLTLTLKGGLDVQFRAYDEGVAYRYLLSAKTREGVIDGETAEFHFAGDWQAWLPYSTNDKKPMAMAYQATYGQSVLSQSRDQLAFLPATVDCGECKLTLMEAELVNYPGMFVRADGTTLRGEFAPYPKSFGTYPWRVQRYVEQTEQYIARLGVASVMPWRIMAVSHADTQMPVNNLVYTLSSPSRISDTSWIKPGKVAWDWWNDWGLSGVPFKAGINMDTYRYYIDFAARYGLEYIVLDEGWYAPRSGDMLTTIPEIDLPELVSYANSKGVGIILWTVFNVLDDQLDEACRRYSEMGIRGFKVDFLDRDDQEAVEMAYRIAERCAQWHLVLDYHGIYKPTGMNRTWPNVVNFESVFGMEEAKWTKHDEQDMPLYDVTFPYIRMQCGPVDFTPGGMRNATRADFQPVYYNPMTMGTRAHQAAMYIVHDTPLTMLADSPTAYEREPEYTRFLASMPTECDETRILQGRMGEYIVTARRCGTTWFVDGQTNWDARSIDLNLEFLTGGSHTATLLTDGPNAAKNASDYVLSTTVVTASSTLHLDMASGGGFVMRIE